MRSVADHQRENDRQAQAQMSATARVELALELGDQDRAIFRRAQGLSNDEALRELRRRRQAGRAACSFFEVHS